MQKVLALFLTLILLCGCNTVISNTTPADPQPTDIKTSDDSNFIESSGVYIFSGEIDGSIVVDADSDSIVTINLKGVTINTQDAPGIYVKKAKSVGIVLEEGTTSTITVSTTLEESDGPDGAIYSKTDLSFSGTGGLLIESSNFDAVKGKGNIYLSDVSLSIRSEAKGINCDGDITVESGIINVSSVDDSLNSDSNISIESGEFYLSSEDDGIHADRILTISGGTFSVSAHEGIEATQVIINDGYLDIFGDDDGINAANKADDLTALVEINGGEVYVKIGQGDTDAIDSNGSIIINGGYVEVSGNSCFDYDTDGTVNGGTVVCNGESVDYLPNQFGGGIGEGGFGGMEPPEGFNGGERPDGSLVGAKPERP